MKKTHIISITVIAYLILQGLIAYFFYLRFEHDIDEQTNINQTHFVNTYQTIFSTFGKLPKSIIDGILNRPYITKKIAKANTSKKAKEKIRKNLFKVLNPLYKDTLSPLNIEQLEIYLKNGERFLQFREPLKFGDITLMQNVALQKVTSTQTIQEGMGKYEDGIFYNYYYPIISNKKFVGTFHLNIPLKTYLKIASNTLQGSQAIFLLDEKSKDSKTNLTNSLISIKPFSKELESVLINKSEIIKNTIIQSKNTLSLRLKYKKNYTLHSLPLFDFEGKILAYIINLKQNKTLPRLYGQMIQDNIVFAFLLILSFVLIFSYKKQIQLYESIKGHKEQLEDLVKERTTELAKSNTFMKTLFHTISSPVFIKNKEGNFIECNDAFIDLLHLRREQIIGKKSADLLTASITHEANESDKIVFENKQQHDFEVTFKNAREKRDFIVNKNILKLNDEIIGIIGVMQDISAKKGYQDRLEKALEENLQQKDQLEEDHQIIDQYTIYAKCNRVGAITEISNALSAISGYSTEELVDKHIEFLFEKTATKQNIEELLYAIDHQCFWENDMQGTRKDGNKYWLKLTIIPKHESNGELHNFLIFGTDISNEMHIKGMSVKDELTQIYNRKKLNESLQETLAIVKRYEHNASFVIFDIDNFKSINDTYGHLVGDSVLKELSHIVKTNVRDVDIFARWGGEEFAIITPKTSVQSALKITEKLRLSINSYEFKHIGSLTCSFGLTEIKSSDKTIDETIARADEALYEAKENGKNRIIVLG